MNQPAFQSVKGSTEIPSKEIFHHVSFQTSKISVGSQSKESENPKSRIKITSDELYGHHNHSGEDMSEDQLRKVRKQQVIYGLTQYALPAYRHIFYLNRPGN